MKIKRVRRLRQNELFRDLFQETSLDLKQLVAPCFIVEGEKIKKEIVSMPGVYQYSVDTLLLELKDLVQLGIRSVLLFGVPSKKDDLGAGAWDSQGIVPEAIRAIKKAIPELLVMSDVCLCAYTPHGHCGLLSKGENDGEVKIANDPTIEVLSKMALVHAEAGVDLVAPSDMMDGRVAAIRKRLDEQGYNELPIMSYAVKYASSFYGPFRDAAESPPKFGDRRSYQMDVGNSEEAMQETLFDVEEGADILMVKPAMTSLDIIARLKQKFHLPIAAYNVSGEYSMVKAAAKNNWLDEKSAVMEMLLSMRRAGAQLIVTYWAKDVAKWLKEKV